MDIPNQFRVKDKETELVIAKIKDSYVFATHTLWSLEVAAITLSSDQVKELITFLEEKQ
jgi:hypothetical protein